MNALLKISLLFVLIGCLSYSCNKDDDDDNTQQDQTNDDQNNDDSNDDNNNNSTPTVDYFRATIDGSEVYIEDGKDDYLSLPYISPRVNYDTYDDAISYGTDYLDLYEIRTGYEIEFNNSFYGDGVYEEVDAFKTIFPVGDHTYISVEPSSSTFPVGVNICLFNNGAWTTYNGDQTGSKFTVTSSIEGNASLYLGGAVRIMEGEFSCKLYNAEDSSVKQVTNGTFRMTVGSNY